MERFSGARSDAGQAGLGLLASVAGNLASFGAFCLRGCLAPLEVTLQDGELLSSFGHLGR